ncbi:MAG: hypothetical protein ABIO92_06455 [Chloroflexia bacterium]
MMDESNAADAKQMLKRIGWDRSELKQIEIYARMEPAKKIAIMLGMRRMQMRLLDTRLRQEHPRCSDAQIAQMIQEHLDLVRER